MSKYIVKLFINFLQVRVKKIENFPYSMFCKILMYCVFLSYGYFFFFFWIYYYLQNILLKLFTTCWIFLLDKINEQIVKKLSINITGTVCR